MMNGLRKSSSIIWFTLFFALVANKLSAQVHSDAKSDTLKALVKGVITDEAGVPIQFVNVVNVDNATIGTSTDKEGYYQLMVDCNVDVRIRATFIGYSNYDFVVNLTEDEVRVVDIVMKSVSEDLQTVVIEDDNVRSTTFDRINAMAATMIPNASNDIGAVIKTLPGVSSVNELSSQYSVRGGNFDENIVYVNGIEVFRPFLTRSGQQEGLSFINSDLISSISFSAGGFEPKYGDKMSSVLDITYRTPQEFGASLTAGLLTSSLHVEDKLGNFTYLAGVRYKTNKFLLGTMDTEGDYNPTFSDVQTLLNYKFSTKFDVSFLGNFSSNRYVFIPESRETTFGTLMESYRMYMYMEGREDDMFTNGLYAVSFNYHPSKITNWSLVFSGYHSVEREFYDVLSEYWIGKLDNNLGSDDYGNVVQSMGVGTFISHARNSYKSSIYTAELKGSTEYGSHFISWGAQFRQEHVADVLNQWELVDSAGYTLPVTPDSIGYVDPSSQPDFNLQMYEYVKMNNTLNSSRASVYVQDRWTFDTELMEMNLIYGIRASYWNVNNDFDVSPRLTFSLLPKSWNKDVMLRFSTGYYSQQPFYRELRDEHGVLHTDVKSQKSVHFVAGSDWNLFLWNRPFKFVSEIYYKYLYDLIPYTVDNVMIQYYPELNAKGYAAGVDFKLTGELVKGVDSWICLSLMKTAERQIDDNGNAITDFYPRPTDQRFNFSVFLQDYIPNNQHVKMQLNLSYGTGLPVYSDGTESFEKSYTRRYPPYLRVDLGLSWQIVSDKVSSGIKFLDMFEDVALSVEVLNLLNKYNTISYTWITDISGRQYSVPDYLTLRSFNVKLSLKY